MFALIRRVVVFSNQLFPYYIPSTLISSTSTLKRSDKSFTIKEFKEETQADYVNMVYLVGRVGHDPKVIALNEKDTVTSLIVVTNNYINVRYSEDIKEVKQFSHWHHVDVYSLDLQEYIEKHVFKGTKIKVLGRLEYSRYKKNGFTMNATKIVAKKIICHDFSKTIF